MLVNSLTFPRRDNHAIAEVGLTGLLLNKKQTCIAPEKHVQAMYIKLKYITNSNGRK